MNMRIIKLFIVIIGNCCYFRLLFDAAAGVMGEFSARTTAEKHFAPKDRLKTTGTSAEWTY